MRPYYDPIVFNNMLDGIDRSKYLIATFFLEDTIPGVDFLDHFALIQQMILEGSTGTWAQVKEETAEVRERLSGKLVGYYEVPAPEGVKKAVVQCAFSIDAWGGDVPMMLLSFAGNCFAYSNKLRLLDVCFRRCS